jgi:hypothetical protein
MSQACQQASGIHHKRLLLIAYGTSGCNTCQRQLLRTGQHATACCQSIYCQHSSNPLVLGCPNMMQRECLGAHVVSTFTHLTFKEASPASHLDMVRVQAMACTLCMVSACHATQPAGHMHAAFEMVTWLHLSAGLRKTSKWSHECVHRQHIDVKKHRIRKLTPPEAVRANGTPDALTYRLEPNAGLADNANQKLRDIGEMQQPMVDCLLIQSFQNASNVGTLIPGLTVDHELHHLRALSTAVPTYEWQLMPWGTPVATSYGPIYIHQFKRKPQQ